MGSKGPADSTLMSLWRRAVLSMWSHTDPLSGWCDLTGESLQCHHIIPRKHFVTRWDVLNGIPLTNESHQKAHTMAGRREIERLVNMDYLLEMERWFKKDYLLFHGISEREFRERKKEELRRVIERDGAA